MSGIRLHGKVPPWGLSGWGWWNGEEQWHQGQRCNTRLPNSPYQCCSLLAGNEKVPEKMIHAARKETVSYAGKDLSNTLMPSSVSPHQAPGKQSLTTRVWIVSMPSVLGTLLLPHAPPPFLPMTNESWEPLCPYVTTPQTDRPDTPVPTAWLCCSSHCPPCGFQLLSTSSPWPVFLHLSTAPLVLWGPPFVLPPDWFQGLWWTLLLLVSFVPAHRPTPNQHLLLEGPLDQV